MRLNISDTNGRLWAKLSELEAGMTIEIDDGFTCAPAGMCTISMDKSARLYFPCKHGYHALDGQADDGEHCIGMYRCD